MSNPAVPPAWVQQLLPAKTTGPAQLAAERSNSKVDPKALETLLYPDDALAMRRAVEDAIANSGQGFAAKLEALPSLGRVEKIERSLERGKALKRLRKKHGWTPEQYAYASTAAGEAHVYGLHDKAFIKCLTDQGSAEQHERFLVPAKADKIIGCYAQTELSHGSNVRGLETTATWNPSDKTFIIHSPSLTASKWWIGTLGCTANHALVMAQLIIDGKNHGPHTFVVPVRDIKTHEPLEGVYVGDIGPKFGFQSMDNGFALFNKVKIPHINMLNRFQIVDPDTGVYQRRGSPAFVYGGMTFLRVGIAADAATTLARAASIAVRYTAVRKQFADDDSKSPAEVPVLDYTMVQFRLLPLIATSYALFFSTQELGALYRSYDQALSGGDQKRAETLLADLHIGSCALKIHGTFISVEGIEAARRSCGGHGYSHYSGIGHLYAEMLPSVTYEGDNYMLSKQVARALVKKAKANDPMFAAYKANPRRSFDWSKDEDVVASFGHRVAFQTLQILALREDGWTWNQLLVPFWRLCAAYAQFVIVRAFAAALPGVAASVPGPTAQAINDLFHLYVAVVTDQYASEFTDAHALPSNRADGLARQKAILALLQRVRPNAVNLMDGWAFSDMVLNSSLGRYDGNVYEDVFKRAAANPVNTLTFDVDPDSDVIVRRRQAVAKL
ncbi:hypothetical protein CcaverHIS002_0700960 [Cutaneotrichosporon cavernicola]|uniref:Acyl-coenzyme A oxidase n=1 Tax=Cutaneotrichosporon cavernicola TaxID=279322 RepID=A0AA48L9R8_9TREE|nr:uncharacterized protein CcaverHIS019_0700970 [Cutaneotrichosporon cavernicola]BEI86750.1 hypothetical protein CcaverHIS002_0700960 [Cutaneotrichosporon cavernicola]BEI94525.1 hypothetical protein CcaverHIS019_0700970 [Cutaneotrichosporon cavernicola]BEJ02301.1 hypothetical protein CcaverHIS631_0700960 [Cutaneotrichosporon cavernicola]BEJ10060.1 hypothetical protein CcaverHIS641_0700950 [Cutaneotrichosporon cavernicola]